MTDTATDPYEERILVLAPLGRDAPLMCRALEQADLKCLVCTAKDLQAQLASGAGILLLTEEAHTPATIATIKKTVEAQPGWSDLPLVLLVNESWQGLKTYPQVHSCGCPCSFKART